MDAFEIAGTKVLPGESRSLSLFIGKLYDYTDISIPLYVVNGREPGPTLCISSSIHGDEINGVEIIRRVLRLKGLKKLKGTLVTVPVVNVFGFNSRSRYLPDRRDLNRSFPGSPRGSLAAQMAYLFSTEVIDRCGYGIDIHTAAVHRSNLPQIRANLKQKETARLAKSFGVPVVVNSEARDGSLREYVASKKIPMLLYEAGEALRYNEYAIKVGVRGVQRVMRSIGMIPKIKDEKPVSSFIAKSSHWVRAPHSGIIRPQKRLGDQVRRNECIAKLHGPLGEDNMDMIATKSGIIIGQTNLPLVNRGDAVFHIATWEKGEDASVPEFDIDYFY